MNEAQEHRRRMEEALKEQTANQEVTSMVIKEHCRIMFEKFQYLIEQGFTREEALRIILEEVAKP